MRYVFIVLLFLLFNAQVAHVEAQSGFILRLNMGGTSDYTTANGFLWQACGNNSTCNGYLSGTGQSANNGNPLSGPIPSLSVDSTVLSTWRQAATGSTVDSTPWSLNIPVTNGTYNIRMYFADYTSTASGQRIFDVLINGDLIIDDLDLYALVGFRYPIVADYTLVVSSGNILIQPRVGAAGLPLINAIEIIEEVDPTPTITPTITPTLAPGNCLFTSSSSQVIESGYIVTLISGSNVEMNGPTIVVLANPGDSYTVETGGVWGFISSGTYVLEICNGPANTATPTPVTTVTPEIAPTTPIETPTAILMPTIQYSNTISNTQLLMSDFVESGTDDRSYALFSLMSLVLGFFVAGFIKWVIWLRD